MSTLEILGQQVIVDGSRIQAPDRDRQFVATLEALIYPLPMDGALGVEARIVNQLVRRLDAVVIQPPPVDDNLPGRIY